MRRGSASTISNAAEVLGDAIHPLSRVNEQYEPLMDLIGEARLVLLGEASHGTHEFYQARADITMRLIQEKGFTAVAVEADWPNAYRVNRFIRGLGRDTDTLEALADFERFPRWMWRNTDIRHFIDRVRAVNEERPTQEAKIGFYGLDLYSLHASIDSVLGDLAKGDPEAARHARYRYSCFDHFGEDSQAYGYAAGFGLSKPCEDEVVAQLLDLRRRAAEYASRDGWVAEDEYFYTEQNARLVQNAEQYYRTMFHGRVSSWNLRDRHMADTLDALLVYLGKQGPPAKIVVWAHNSHLGDARATQMGEAGELNVGQLVRERYGQDARLIGFSTYTGTVTAASVWDGPAERKRVRPALPESYEALFHDVGLGHFLVSLKGHTRAVEILREPRLERAIGVIYLPDTERVSHYFRARLSDQFDAVLHFDETQAVEPLDQNSGWEAGEAPETFPTGM
jgi:erythromycin esterase-like protein